MVLRHHPKVRSLDIRSLTSSRKPLLDKSLRAGLEDAQALMRLHVRIFEKDGKFLGVRQSMILLFPTLLRLSSFIPLRFLFRMGGYGLH
jgi:hypothetical protein